MPMTTPIGPEDPHGSYRSTARQPHEMITIPATAAGFLSAVRIAIKPTGGWPVADDEDDPDPCDCSQCMDDETDRDTADQFEEEPYAHPFTD